MNYNCCGDDFSVVFLIFGLVQVPSFKPVMVTDGHRGIIYDVCWSGDDSILVSASADGLVKYVHKSYHVRS